MDAVSLSNLNAWRVESAGARPLLVRVLLPLASIDGPENLMLTAACERSDQCQLGDLFACIDGARDSGRRYVDEAIRHGARLFLTSERLDIPYPQVIVPKVRDAFSRICHALAGAPSSQLTSVGITGTNGKSSTAWFLRSIWDHVGKRSGLLGTIEYDDSVERVESGLTSPPSAYVANFLKRLVDQGASHIVSELSSHAIEQRRNAGMGLDAAVVTNVTCDHMDYHGTSENYVNAKAGIADLLKPFTTLWLQSGGAGTAAMREIIQNRASRDFIIRDYGVGCSADLSAKIISSDVSGSRFVVTYQGERVSTEISIPGLHNVENAMAAIASAVSTGVSFEGACEGVSKLKVIPGRLERVAAGQDFDCFVDYAHTADGLERVLSLLKGVTRGRLICVFGAGGDRDKSKRPMMGRAARIADCVLITSDNPRREDPMTIIEQIHHGFVQDGPCAAECELVVDRREAIEKTIGMAKEGDCVLIAGKGHEKEQVIGSQRLEFDDRKVAIMAITHAGKSVLPFDAIDTTKMPEMKPWRKTG